MLVRGVSRTQDRSRDEKQTLGKPPGPGGVENHHPVPDLNPVLIPKRCACVFLAPEG